MFDRLIRESVKELFNGLIDALAGTTGAGEVGTTEIEGVTGGDVQTVLGSLKTILDTKSASADVTAALSLKSDKSVTDLHFKSVALSAETGVFTFTREDGSFVTIDTVLEKVATNWQYDASTQSLVLTLADGATQSVPLSAFITETEFEDSAQIAFSVNDHTVTATVKAGSITDAMLSSALIAQLQGYVSSASGSASAAAQSATAAEGYKNAASGSAAAAAGSASAASNSATAAGNSAGNAASSASAAEGSADDAAESAADAEAWAVGQRNGVDVESTDPAYHNNAKYYKNQAAEIVGGDFATRTEVTQAVSAHNGANDAHSDIRQAVGTKAAASDLTSHTGDATAHVTAAEKAAWNAKQDALTFDQTPTANSENPVTSGGTYNAIADAVANTGFFRGSYATKAALDAVSWQSSDQTAAGYVTNNDVAVVLSDETHSGECWRYVYVAGTGWAAQYRVNEAPLTEAQAAALNSGITEADKTKLNGIASGATANSAYTSNPAMNGTASAGSSANYSRGDHVHPTDTTRQPKTLETPLTIDGASKTTVEAALAALNAALSGAGGAKTASGTYTGTGGASKTLTLGFKPKMVFVFPRITGTNGSNQSVNYYDFEPYTSSNVTGILFFEDTAVINSIQTFGSTGNGTGFSATVTRSDSGISWTVTLAGFYQIDYYGGTNNWRDYSTMWNGNTSQQMYFYFAIG